MTFDKLQAELLRNVQARVRNGEMTERQLARLTGISQPHVHNVLKGARFLSWEIADEILRCLGLNVLDLIAPDQLLQHLSAGGGNSTPRCKIPLLAGRIGPGHPWPTGEGGGEIGVPVSQVVRMNRPVATRLAHDHAMWPLFSGGEIVLLDQAPRSRQLVEEDALYLLRRRHCGLVRYLRLQGGRLYMASAGLLDDRSAWQMLPVNGRPMESVVRARVRFLPEANDLGFSPLEHHEPPPGTPLELPPLSWPN